MTNQTIVIAKGDGIGPEIMESVLEILKASGAKLNYKTIEIGEKLYNQGLSTGISKEAWEAIKEHKIMLKAPITTPQGKGYKSLNVTFRKVLGLFANVRPVASFQPFVSGPDQKMDMIIVRENEEDLYAGIEYRATTNSYVSLKLISRSGCEKIIHYAFEYARANKRSKVTCVVKDNIMKITDGLFHNVFKEIATQYPEISTETYIVDIGAARIASKPQNFDVIVTLNLYGDILSDIASEVSGSVGLAGSANIGSKYAMFEAIHGSAPDIAGKNIANPSGLLNAATMMLNHIGQSEIATKIQNAWLKTIEDGLHTEDIFNQNSKQKLSTKEFTNAVIKNLGSEPKLLKSIKSGPSTIIDTNISLSEQSSDDTKRIGIDLYLLDHSKNPEEVAAKFTNIENIKLNSIAQRGLLVWPNSESEEFNKNMMRLRFLTNNKQPLSSQQLAEIIGLVERNGFEITMINSLYSYDDIEGFSKAQGE